MTHTRIAILTALAFVLTLAVLAGPAALAQQPPPAPPTAPAHVISPSPSLSIAIKELVAFLRTVEVYGVGETLAEAEANGLSRIATDYPHYTLISYGTSEHLCTETELYPGMQGSETITICSMKITARLRINSIWPGL